MASSDFTFGELILFSANNPTADTVFGAAVLGLFWANEVVLGLITTLPLVTVLGLMWKSGTLPNLLYFFGVPIVCAAVVCSMIFGGFLGFVAVEGLFLTSLSLSRFKEKFASRKRSTSLWLSAAYTVLCSGVFVALIIGPEVTAVAVVAALLALLALWMKIMQQLDARGVRHNLLWHYIVYACATSESSAAVEGRSD